MPVSDYQSRPLGMIGGFIYGWHWTPRGFLVTRSWYFIDRHGEKDTHSDELDVHPTRLLAEDAVERLEGRRMAA